MFRLLFIFIILLLGFTNPGNKDKKKSAPKKHRNISAIKWENIENGLQSAFFDAPLISEINDSKITALKINPDYFSFHLLTASENDKCAYTVQDWCENENLVAAINAGMFDLDDYSTSMGFMKNNSHFNNPDFRYSYRAMLMFNTNDIRYDPIFILDMDNEDLSLYINKYNTMFQSIKMIDCNQVLTSWQKVKNLSSSMVVVAKDTDGNILFFFTRSPYSIDEFSSMLLELPLNIYMAMYMEGGPEASIYAKTKDTLISKVGSWVSTTYRSDKNDHHWKLPNVLGIRKKKL